MSSILRCSPYWSLFSARLSCLVSRRLQRLRRSHTCLAESLRRQSLQPLQGVHVLRWSRRWPSFYSCQGRIVGLHLWFRRMAYYSRQSSSLLLTNLVIVVDADATCVINTLNVNEYLLYQRMRTIYDALDSYVVTIVNSGIVFSSAISSSEWL